MPERTFTLGCVIAAVLWGLTGLCILAGTIVGITARGGVGIAVAASLMAHGLACSAGAATVTIRNGLKTQNRLLQDAFKLGQEQATSVRRISGG